MDNKSKKRKIIIDVAIKLFVERGFHGTPTSLIAKEAGIGTGTLFNYFKTKDILINELYKEIKREQKKNILKGLENSNTPKLKLKKIWNNLIIWGIENPKHRRFSRYFSDSSFISDDTKTEINKNYRFMFSIFTDLTKDKETKKILMLMFNFIGSCIFTGEYFYETKESYDEELCNESFERFFKGIDLDSKE